ncbi:hypothetical protein Dimus_030654 [Dionaea muscipula]
MESHDPSPPPSHHHHPHHHHHHHHQGPPQLQQSQPGMMIPTTNSSYSTQQQPPPNLHTTPPHMINPNSSSMLPSSRYLFNTQPSTSTNPLESLNSPFSGEGSSGLRPGGFSIACGDSSKKKRGRPRKYSPDGGGGNGGNIALQLAPTPISPSLVAAQGGDSGGTPSSDATAKKHRGRPPSSGKRQLDALGNCGVGFTPHVIMVDAGEVCIMLLLVVIFLARWLPRWGIRFITYWCSLMYVVEFAICF